MSDNLCPKCGFLLIKRYKAFAGTMTALVREDQKDFIIADWQEVAFCLNCGYHTRGLTEEDMKVLRSMAKADLEKMK